MTILPEQDKPKAARGRPRNPTGRKITGRGHVLVRQADGTWIPEHRLVLEALLGRKLLSDEKVKHLDDNRANNDPANLEIWQSIRVWPT